jgi:hypothetical protein
MSNRFEEIIAEASPRVEALARGTKALIQNVMPDVVEVPWPKQKIIGYGVGPKKMSEHFCYIGIFKNHVNLGFYYGAELPDPENLLEGSGKLLRHIKIARIEQLENPAIHRLVAAASKHLPKLDKA